MYNFFHRNFGSNNCVWMCDYIMSMLNLFFILELKTFLDFVIKFLIPKQTVVY